MRSIFHWHERLHQTHYYNEEADEIQLSEPDEFLLVLANILKAGVIPNKSDSSIENNLRVDALLKGYPFSTASVNSITSYEIWKMADNSDLSHVREACQNANPFSIEIDRNEEWLKDILTPHDFYIKQNSPFEYEAFSSAHVVINLSATDEQIKNDFNHWLTHYRKAVAYQRQKKLFTQVDFDYWVEYGVIPYLDLVLIAKIVGKKITQNKLARLIFPNEFDVDVVERIRKVTKPTAEWLINNEIHKTLSTQLTYEKTAGMKNA